MYYSIVRSSDSLQAIALGLEADSNRKKKGFAYTFISQSVAQPPLLSTPTHWQCAIPVN